MADPGGELASRTQYDDQTFTQVRMDSVEIASSVFSDCTFVRCSFGKTTFRSCRFLNCVFQHCDLSLARVPNAFFSGVRFEDSKTVGVSWSDAKWSGKIQEPLAFVRCVVSHASFNSLQLMALKLCDCLAVDVDFRDANLSGADFTGTDLSESLFSNTNLCGADFSKARNYSINPGRNILTRAKFSLPEALALLYSLEIVLTSGSEQ
jgi:fluoroquinolone resistance protein